VFVRCPSDVRANISEHSTALVNWTVPVALDNSKLSPNVTVVPAGISPPHIFNKTTLIVYTARDVSGNKNECSFRVVLEGEQKKKTVYDVFCQMTSSFCETCLQGIIAFVFIILD